MEQEESEILQKQVALQCQTIVYLCGEIASVYEFEKRLHESRCERSRLICDHAYGKQTYDLMEYLADVLNNMDAVDEDTPVFVDQAFEHGRLMFGEDDRAPDTEKEAPC